MSGLEKGVIPQTPPGARAGTGATWVPRDDKQPFQVIAAHACESWGMWLEDTHPNLFKFHITEWGKFPDGTDKINIGGFHPTNEIRGRHVIFLASFHNNDTTLSQLYVCIAILESLVKSLTIVLPFYPVGTMERVTVEGEVATANTLARLLSSLPPCGKTTRVMLYDLHTLQNRFYLSNHAIATMHSTIPMLLNALAEYNSGHEPGDQFKCIAFPDDGAAKRFTMFFTADFHIVVCGKKREGDERKVVITDGEARDMNIVIVDDLVQTGGTLNQCGKALKEAGAKKVACFVAHGVFPNQSWRRFMRDGQYKGVLDPFWLTNSIPTVSNEMPRNDVFKVLDILPQLVKDFF